MKQEAGPGFPPWPGTTTRDVERNLAAYREMQALNRRNGRSRTYLILVGILAFWPIWFVLGLEWPTISAYVTLLRRGIGV